MRFKLTNDFLDADQVRHLAGDVIEYPDNADIIPALSWAPMDEAAKTALEKAAARKDAAKKAAAEASNAPREFKIVEEPKPAPKSPPLEPMTLREAGGEPVRPKGKRSF